jgi:pilus assembly protein CpaC
MMIQKKRACLLTGLCAFGIFSLLFSAGSRAATLGGTVRLTLGQQTVLDVPAPLEQVAIGDPKVVDVKIISEGRQILITAIGRGTTDVLTWDMYGKQSSTVVQVILKDVRLIRNEVQGILGEIEGVEVRVVGERVVIDGEVYTRRDFDRIKTVADIYPSEVTLLARMSSSVTRLIASEINRSLVKNGYADVRAEGIGSKIFLEGTVLKKEDLDTINTLAGAYFDACVNLVRVGGVAEDLVLIDIHFVELGKQLLQRVGVDWDNSARFEISSIEYTLDLVQSGQDQGQIELEAGRNFGANLNLLETNSIARVLAHPRLVCKSGEEAEFVAGGEIPIVLILQDRAVVEYKKYGIILKVSPLAHRDGRVSASVEAENSALDFSVTVNDYPGLRTRSVDTYVTLDKDKVLVLSGLVGQEEAKAVDRVPVIGHFPILGELFKSRDFTNDDTELVIFLTASLMSPEAEKNREMLRDIERRYDATGEKIRLEAFD